MTSQWISEVMEWAAGGKQDQITEISAESAHHMFYTQVVLKWISYVDQNELLNLKSCVLLY